MEVEEEEEEEDLALPEDEEDLLFLRVEWFPLPDKEDILPPEEGEEEEVLLLPEEEEEIMFCQKKGNLFVVFFFQKKVFLFQKRTVLFLLLWKKNTRIPSRNLNLLC